MIKHLVFKLYLQQFFKRRKDRNIKIARFSHKFANSALREEQITRITNYSDI